MHWGERYAIRNDWFEYVRAICGVKYPKMTHKCVVSVVRVAKRTLDPLNCYSAYKPLADSLVEYGHLRGDTFKDIVISVDQRKCEKGDQEHTEITIEETTE